MKRASLALLVFVTGLSPAWSQTAGDSPADAAAQTSTQAAAALASGQASVRTPDFLEHLVDVILGMFDVRTSGNTLSHYVIASLLLVGFYLLRRVVTTFIFGFLRKLAAKTQTTLDDKLFPALEAPVATFIALLGAFAALKVLKLSTSTDRVLGYASTVAFSLCVFWLLLRAFNAVLDHLHEIAVQKSSGVAAFMPWIKKTLLAVFFVIGGLMIVQSLGYNVSTILQGLGIGGLAFALAAQDTIANLFGSVVVAIDQPFRIGEMVKIGPHLGVVEDIGLRSTKLRAVDKSLIVLPNKMVASEVVTNLARFTERRVEQVLGLTYDTSPEQMDAIVGDFRRIIVAEPEIDPASVLVFFRDYSASSLDIWIVYVAKDADFAKFMQLRQRINLALMRAVQARGLSFAFPTQTIELGGSAARTLGAGRPA
jgi:MscS family membrane protein